MVYETEIKLKDYTIIVEFDTNTEEFSYQIKSRRKANEKKSESERTGKFESGKSESGNITGSESESDSDFL